MDTTQTVWADLIIVAYSPEHETYAVSARPSAEHDWTLFEGSAEEIDTLMSLARDVMTGG